MLLHSLKGEQTGLYFVDSTKLAVCHNASVNRNKMFEGTAQRGKSTMGWFYGFKLNIVINHKGKLMAVRVTSGKKDDRAPVEDMVRNLKGKLFGDKGYIAEKLRQTLWQKGIHLITGIRKNMKNYLMPMMDKILLRKRFIIETIVDKLKSQMGIEHTRHRSQTNAFVHIMSCLIAYSLGKKKPKINASYP